MNGFYRHERFLDVYVWVLKVQYKCANYRKIKIEWWLNSSSMGIRQNIKIKSDQFKNWSRCDFHGVFV